MSFSTIEPGTSPATCLLCSAEQPRRLFFRSGKWFWICPNCELVFVHDIYPEFASGQDSSEELKYHLGAQSSKPRRRRKLARLINELEPYRQRNRLLDIGCSVGTFLNGAEELGWRCSGVEIVPEIARYARDECDLDVRTGELRDAKFPAEEFDVVYMTEVIEHIVDPVELLTEVKRVLRPGGVAILRTGNARSWSARFRGAAWGYYRFGEHGHIRYYSPRAALSLARATGFGRVDTHTHGFALRSRRELRGRSRWFKLLVRLLQGAVSPWAGLFGRGHRLSIWLHSSKSETRPSIRSRTT